MRNPFQRHYELYKDLGGAEGVKYLRNNVQEIKRLEKLDALHDLELIEDINIVNGVLLEYSARAPSLFPHVRQRLIEKGIARSTVSTKREDVGTSEETYRVHMTYHSGMLQIALTVRK